MLVAIFIQELDPFVTAVVYALIVVDAPPLVQTGRYLPWNNESPRVIDRSIIARTGQKPFAKNSPDMF